MNNSQDMIVNDVTQLNPVRVATISRPDSVEGLQSILRQTSGPISIGGGRFSMGGQTASPGSHHIDMRGLNQVLWLDPANKLIRVQAGIRWCDIQRFVDPHDLSIKIMQTYANFTVGGSLSVNCHGRYVGLGPVILSVREITLVLANGDAIKASATENSELFYGAVGGYGGLGIIVEIELELTENTRVERSSERMPVTEYLAWFKQHVRSSTDAVYHNADIYPDHYSRVNAVTWSKTQRAATGNQRLMSVRKAYWLEKYFFWIFSETFSGKWWREHLIDPLLFASRKVHWRNYEAGYDVAELEPLSRRRATYVLQEYFIPIDRFDEFVPRMVEILQRHGVNMVNISIRHARGDSGSLLAWASEEVFAFVMYYKQRVRDNAKQRVAVWTRELIDAAIECGGRHYLPYQPHATDEQFHEAYPRARELFGLKDRLDPDYRFRNVLWDTYYRPAVSEGPPVNSSSEFHGVYSDVRRRDRFYWFLQNVFRLQPEDRLHKLILDATSKFDNDEDIYRHIQDRYDEVKPPLADLKYALPALKKQKHVISEQTAALLDLNRRYDGYLEIGSTGRYYSALRKKLSLAGPAYFISDVAPGYGPPDLIDRGRIRQFGPFIDLGDYAPISPDAIPDASLDLVTCYIGLHHVQPEILHVFVASIARVLRSGGVFVLRDHDAPDHSMRQFVALVHTVFNAGTGETWETNAAEPRFFEGLDHWVSALAAVGLIDQGQRLYQDHDPSDNVLMAFVKQEGT